MLERILYEALPVLDHGFIRIVDYMGDDGSIVQAARVSYGRGTRRLNDDRNLIRYLLRHAHSTPFEMAEIKFHVKLPIFVARQWMRHRTANVTETRFAFNRSRMAAHSVTTEARFRRKGERVPSYLQPILHAGWERSMPTAELTDVGRNGYNSSRSQDDVAHSWDLLSPTEAATDGDASIEEQAFGAKPSDEQPFQPAERSDIRRTLIGFGSHRMLIVGAAIAATFAVGVLAYLFWPAGGEKEGVQNSKASSAVQSELVAPGQAAPRIPESSPSGPTSIAWPDLPPSGISGSSSQITASVGNAETRHALATPNRDIVFLQRPGVNIRSTPAASGPIVGTAPKGTRFKIAKRDGDWAQVEGDRLKGWINSKFLGPHDPR